MKLDPSRLKVARQLDHSAIFFAMCRVPGTARLFAGASDGKVYAVDLGLEQPQLQEMPGHESYVTGVALAGDLVVSGAYDGQLIWWNSQSLAPLRKVAAHGKWIRGVTASRDGRWVASVADDMICKVWDARTGELAHALAGHQPMTPHHYPSMLFAAAFSPDGRHLATADKIGHIVVWDLDGGQQAAALEAPTMYTWDPRQRRHSIGGIRSLAFSSDGKLLAAGGTGQINNVDHLEANARVEIFDWREGKRLVEQPGDKHKGLVERLEFSSASDWLLCAGGAHEGFVMVLSASDGKILHQEKAPAHLYDFELDEASREFFAAGHGKLVRYEFMPDPEGSG